MTEVSSYRDHLPPRVGIRVINLYCFEIRCPIETSDCHQLTIHHSQAHLETQTYFHLGDR